MNTEHLNLSDFTKLDIRGALRFQIMRSDSFGVTLNRSWYKLTRAFKEGDVLVVDDPWYDVLGWFTPWIIPEAKVEMPELCELRISGASRGSLTGFQSSQDFKLLVHGASRLSGAISAGKTEIDVTGASKIELAASVKALKLSVVGASDLKGSIKTGSADIEVFGASRIKFSGNMGDVSIKAAGGCQLDMGELSVHDANIKLAGASRCSLNIEGKLDAELAGASRLTYGGNPIMGNIRIAGASILTKN
jgi:hypothetical protein